MAKYRCIKQTLLQKKGQKPILKKIGDEVLDTEFDGRPRPSNLEPLDKAAEDAMAEAAVFFEEEDKRKALAESKQLRAASAGLADMIGAAIGEALAGFTAKASPKAKLAAAE